VSVTGLLPPTERGARIAGLVAEPGEYVLVCIDCLSEGINLQQDFNAVVHYDLVRYRPVQRVEYCLQMYLVATLSRAPRWMSVVGQKETFPWARLETLPVPPCRFSIGHYDRTVVAGGFRSAGDRASALCRRCRAIALRPCRGQVGVD